MPGSTVEEVQHETIESPYRLAWTRVGKVVIPLLLIVLAAAYWFIYIYIPAQIEPESPTMIPTTKIATPSAKKATPSAKKDETVSTFLVNLVKQDLAKRTGASLNNIDVLQIDERVWPDTCLGLPAPELCAPGKTPGYRMILTVSEQKYIYHTDKNGTFRYSGPADP